MTKTKYPPAPLFQRGVIEVPPFEKGRLGGIFLFALCLFPFALCRSVSAADPTPPRLFFSDASISFTFPNHWSLDPKFPYGALFTKPTREGKPAVISCAISAPLDSTHMTADISQQVLKQLARTELETHEPGYQTVSDKDRTLSEHNAYEITWDNVVDSETVRHQTLYFFVENRIYALSLQTSPKSFRWLEPDFQHWLGSLRILSRKEAASLSDPAHGGIWIHQTGGVKITLPETWLLGVADDRQLGAVLAQGDQNVSFTATVEVSSPTAKTFTRHDRKEAVKAVHQKGLRIVSDTEDAFHGYPSYTVHYEGMLKDRVIKGVDVWVLSPKGHWLFNLEGDVSLYNSLSVQLEDILKNIEFI